MHNYNSNNSNMNYSRSSSSYNNKNNSDADIEQNTQQQQQKEQQLEMQQPTADRTRTGTTSSTASTNTATKGNGNGNGNGNSSTAAATPVSASASAFTSMSKTRARAMSLIYLPPFCSPCGHVVPAATVSNSSARSRSRSRSRRRRSPSRSHSRSSPSRRHTSTSSSSSSGSNCCSCCCCCNQSGWTHKDYDKEDARTATSASSSSSKFLQQRDIQLPEGHGMHIDLRQASQLVTSIAEGGHEDTDERRERMRRQRPSHAASAARDGDGDDDGANEQAAAVAADDDDDDDDECRCFNYNGDISEQKQEEQKHTEEQELQLEHGEWYQLPSITWLKNTWQQLLMLPLGSNATTETTKMTTTKTTMGIGMGMDSSRSSSGSSSSGRSWSSYAFAMTTTKSWLAPWMLTLLLATSVSGRGGRQDAPTNCTFPAHWEGSWFLSGYQQSVHIKGSQFSYRGRCAAKDGDKYLIVDEKGCHRCLVIYEKHKNVLQYKESECEGDSMFMHQSNPSALAMRSSKKQSDHRGGAHPNTNGHSRLSSSDQYIMRSNDDMNDYFCKGRETLQNLCDQIPGDAWLYSLFRESAEPVKCPIKGPFIFTYNSGHGDCKSPVSNIESCTEESRLLLNLQACPDVAGTESTVEELTCLATWKDGNSRYLVGLVSHHHAISNEERYRCFVYEKISLMALPGTLSSKDAEYKLAQSGDATCNGLDSADVGSRIMLLRKPPAAERCDFPAWFKGPRHWHALMGNAVYNYHSNDGSVHIIKPNGYMETRALCEQINKQTATEMMAVVHYTTGCQSGFMCMMFYRRDTHVIEIQTGKPAVRLEDACAPDHFDFNKMAYITLLASNPELHICPMEGLYNLRGAIGPPYLATRHKRNHNGKSHLGHGHHHHENSDSGDFSRKGHSSLSFRNAERMERGSWHANTRGLPVRSRRNAPQQQQQQQQQQQAQVLDSNSNDTSVGFIAMRSRRDVPGCVTNYNAQRQLLIGCTAPNAIDVNPLCSVDGEEEYSCHGSWNENNTVYIIARHKGTKHGVCISYRPLEGNAAKLVVGDACYRGTQKPPDHHLVANLSIFGKCGETGSSASTNHLANLLLLCATLTWLTLQS